MLLIVRFPYALDETIFLASVPPVFINTKLEAIEMRTIIAGSRAVGRLSARKWDYDYLKELVSQAVAESGIEITTVISGGAGGPDRAGEIWAETTKTPVEQFKPDWRLGRGAGLKCNGDMVATADALIAIYDGKSKGTLDMIEKMKRARKKVFVLTVASNSQEE